MNKIPTGCFDLTTSDLIDLEIKRQSNEKNCYIQNKNTQDFITTFILDKNTRTLLTCEVTFYPSSKTSKYVPRLIFKRKNLNFEEKQEKETENYYFNKAETCETFWKFIGFLKSFKDIVDTGDFEKKFSVSSVEFIDEFAKQDIGKQKNVVRQLMDKLQQNDKQDNGFKTIQSLLDDGTITSDDIVNTGYRKAQLNIFDRLLKEEGYIQEYKKTEKSILTLINEFEKKHQKTISEKSKDEITWQYFFNKNPWIFGYGLDYRFQNILQKEFSASDTDASGKGQVNTDFLIGDNNFTTFVEIKKPETDIFDDKNRSGSWKFSKDLTYAVSQILEQKARGEIKIETTRNLSLSNGEYLKQHSYDSKCILIFGNLEKEILDYNETKRDILKKTFELYRRNSRNIEILTYDELYCRAEHICKSNNKKVC